MRLLIALLLFFSVAYCEKPLIILDPGHGGKDEGAHIQALYEKKLTLRTCYLTKKHLQDLGYNVVMTRARDIYVSLPGRVEIANRRDNALFVSIHFNSSASPTAKGIEIYYHTVGQRASHSKKLGSAILASLVKETACHSRGVRRGNFHVIRETTMPAVLVEAGFLTNPEERSEIAKQSYLDKIAKGIALGVDEYLFLN